jgi:hypothetical protein
MFRCFRPWHGRRWWRRHYYRPWGCGPWGCLWLVILPVCLFTAWIFLTACTRMLWY